MTQGTTCTCCWNLNLKLSAPRLRVFSETKREARWRGGRQKVEQNRNVCMRCIRRFWHHCGGREEGRASEHSDQLMTKQHFICWPINGRKNEVIEMQMGRFGWITTSCKHAMEFWCTMEPSWQLRSENVEAVSKTTQKMSHNDEEKTWIVIPSHGWILNFASLLQHLQHIWASIHALESNECHSLGSVFIPFYEAQINQARVEERRYESNIMVTEGRCSRWVCDECRWGCGFFAYCGKWLSLRRGMVQVASC